MHAGSLAVGRPPARPLAPVPHCPPVNAASAHEPVGSAVRQFRVCTVFILTISHTGPKVFLPVINSALWTEGGWIFFFYHNSSNI